MPTNTPPSRTLNLFNHSLVTAIAPWLRPGRRYTYASLAAYWRITPAAAKMRIHRAGIPRIKDGGNRTFIRAEDLAHAIVYRNFGTVS